MCPAAGTLGALPCPGWHPACPGWHPARPWPVHPAHPLLLPAQPLVFLLQPAQGLLFPNTGPGEKAKQTALTPSPALLPCPLLATPVGTRSPLAAGMLQLLPQSGHLLPQLGLLRLTLG